MIIPIFQRRRKIKLEGGKKSLQRKRPNCRAMFTHPALLEWIHTGNSDLKDTRTDQEHESN